MAGYYYMTLKAQKQGEIKGDVTIKGHENSIELDSISWGQASPRDPSSGLPTGKRQMKPLYIRSKYSKASPLLMNAAAANENLTKCTITCVRLGDMKGIGAAAGGKGGLQSYLTIELTNATISEFKVVTETTESGGEAKQISSGHDLTTEVGFVFQKITWTWLNGGIVASDDWSLGIT